MFTLIEQHLHNNAPRLRTPSQLKYIPLFFMIHVIDFLDETIIVHVQDSIFAH